MTPTVADAFALTCLRPMGAFAHPLMTIGIGPSDDILNAICKFLACTSSKRVINYYLPIAQCLANGTPVDLSSFLLGELYRSLFLLSTEPKQSHGGPVWLIQMWAYSYFPSIAPELHPIIEPWSYGEAWMHARYPKEVPSYPTDFKLFSDSSRRRSPENFMPFKAKSAGFEHIASYVTPQPLQQISPSRKKIGGDSSSQKFATAEVSSDPLISLIDIVTDRVTAYNAELPEMAFDLRNQLMKFCQANLLQNAALKKAKEDLKLQAPILRLPASSEQGTRTSTKRKIPEVEEVNLDISTKGAKSSSKKRIAKKARVVEVILDSSIIEVEPLDEELDDTTAMSNLMRKLKEAKQLAAALNAKTKAEDAERKRLEAKELEKKKKEEEEKKKKKEEREKEKKEEAEAARRKAEQVVPRKAELTKQAVGAAMMSVQKVAQPTIEAQNMPDGLGDIEKLLEDVSLTLQQYQTPTKTSSTLTPLEPTKDQLQVAIDQLKELLQKPVGLWFFWMLAWQPMRRGIEPLVKKQTISKESQSCKLTNSTFKPRHQN
uniref:Aminotransferase-like plant mobile domain-containing protein n=1 Tax=Fagus sylvatica TaxID=28930 RepID=A0A2N9GZI7_FAGSY